MKRKRINLPSGLVAEIGPPGVLAAKRLADAYPAWFAEIAALESEEEREASVRERGTEFLDAYYRLRVEEVCAYTRSPRLWADYDPPAGYTCVDDIDSTDFQELRNAIDELTEEAAEAPLSEATS